MFQGGKRLYDGGIEGVDQMKKISKSEQRAIRREFINEFLHKGWKTQSLLKQQVRLEEYFQFGKELKAYK